MKAQDQLIVALDFPSSKPALHLVDRLGEPVLWYKVGLELYVAEGASIVRTLVARGKRVFLDLKLHDIPNTVAGAVRSAASTGASLLTVHAAGGPAMLSAAAQAAGTSLDLLAVTVLTSMDETELSQTGIERSAAEQVRLLGIMALNNGMAGLVCSPHEITGLRSAAGASPILIVPGIRPVTKVSSAATDDQRRSATAVDAIRAGASKIVVGRPITQAADPVVAVELILAEIEAGLGIA